MADGSVAPPPVECKSRIPEHCRLAEPQIVALYQQGLSVRALVRQFGINHNNIQRMLERNGVQRRGMAQVGVLCRQPRVTPLLSYSHARDSLRSQVAASLGLKASDATLNSREFKTHYSRELRRYNIDRYREVENRRKKFLNRIPAWESRARIIAFLEMAHDLGLEVDHIVPLQGKAVCGLNTISNFRLVSRERNQSKQNKFSCAPDHLIGHPSIHH